MSIFSLGLKNFSLILLVTCFFYADLSGQNDIHNFYGLQSEGQIPNEFLVSWGEKAASDLSQEQIEEMRKSERKKMEKFWIGNHNFLNDILKSGSITLNDPISLYVNKVKDELLRNHQNLKNDITVYIYKSPAVNAFMSPGGTLFIYSGLISRLNNEAELAFVLAHEIDHYHKKHGLEHFEELEEIIEGRNSDYKNKNDLELMDVITKRSQHLEFDADEGGMQLFLQSDYNNQAFEGVLDFLYYNHLPFAEVEVSHDILNTNHLKIPTFYFTDSLDPLEEEVDEFDETRTHPNTFKRRENLRKMYASSVKKEGKDFINSEEEFYKVRNLARFEQVRLLVANAYYGNALYNIYVLQKDFPNNKFLEISKVKALYGLAAFKAKNEYSSVARSFKEVQGESQQVHYLLRQFDRKQLTTLALHHLLVTAKKYPEEKYIKKYINALTKCMYVDCKITMEDFIVENATLSEFPGKPDDYKSEREYIRAQQRHYGDFYKYLAQEEVKSGWLKANLYKHQKALDSINNELTMLARDKKKREEEIEKELEKEGAKLYVRKIIMLDPSYIVINTDDPDELNEARQEEEMLKHEVLNWSRENKIEASPLYLESMTKNDIDAYNNYAALKEWVSEAVNFYYFDLMPTSVDLLDLNEVKLSSKYLCKVTCLSNEETRKAWYNFTLFDLHKGEVIYTRREDFRNGISLKEIQKEIQTDFERIYN